MKVELTKEEANNVVVALASLAKSPNATINEMKVLLVLSDKFIWKEPVNEVKEESKEVKEEKK